MLDNTNDIGNTDITVETWGDLQKLLFNFVPVDKLNRFRSSYAYRGVDSAEYKLETSLMRLKNHKAEKHLLRNFKKYARSVLKDDQNVWELLAVAQHYGLPTRLLDWSFSPYVALHFATSNTDKFKEDGAVWCLNIPEVHKLLPESYSKKLELEESYVFTVDMLNEITADMSKENGIINVLEFFDGLKIDGDFVVCLEPPSIDERIINQYAMFTVISNSETKLEDLLEDYGGIYQKIIIPAHLKLEIRDKLDQANINERMIYPGLQGISTWLKRYYENLDDKILVKPEVHV